jgi:glycosyltransferase involved in cell wall biosynthesis
MHNWKDAKVVIAVPNYSCLMDIDVHQSIIGLEKTNDTYVLHAKRSLIDRARNKMVEFAVHNGYDYILFIDDDNIFPSDMLKVLLEKDKDVVVPVIPRRGYNHEKTLVFDDKHESLFPKEDTPIFSTGMGCCLIKREVFEPIFNETMGRPFEFKKAYNNGTVVEMTEDVTFCSEVNARGFEIWATPEVPVEHIGGKYTLYYDKGEIKTKHYI